MEHENNAIANQDTARQGSGNGQGEQQPTTQHGIRPYMTVPPTVLVTELDNGTLILQERPDGPRAWLSPADAVPLKRELAAAFGRTVLTAAGDDQCEAQ